MSLQLNPIALRKAKIAYNFGISERYRFNKAYTLQADTLDVLSDLREVRRVMDKTAIDRRHKLQEEKDQIVSQMIVDGIKVREKYGCT